MIAGSAGEPSVALDRAGITVFRDITFLAAGPASELGRSAAEEETRMDEFVCPGCSAHLTQRQLLMTSVVTETCPCCRSVVRQGDAFRYENV